MVMVDLRVTLAEALSRMRARAFASDTTLLDVADQVIAGILTAESWSLGRHSRRDETMTILIIEEAA